MLDEIYAFVDEELKKLTDEVRKSDHKIACDWCNTPHCCNMMISVWPSEARHIAGVMRTWHRKGRRTMQRRISKWITHWRKQPPEIRCSDGEWFKLSRACPFLDDGLCSIYKDRPAGCRTHYVVNQVPEVCGELVNDNVLDVVEIHQESADRGITSHGLYFVPLPLLVAYEFGSDNVTLDEIMSTFGRMVILGRAEVERVEKQLKEKQK
tara:strand:+ start:870 stop:1496 length:627 start_codon:yes stop_codon:yes gene_type:complete